MRPQPPSLEQPFSDPLSPADFASFSLAVKALVDFDGMLNSGVVSPPVALWISANPSPPGEIPFPLDLSFQHFSPDLGVRSLPLLAHLALELMLLPRSPSASASRRRTSPSPLSATSGSRSSALLSPSRSSRSPASSPRPLRSTTATVPSLARSRCASCRAARVRARELELTNALSLAGTSRSRRSTTRRARVFPSRSTTLRPAPSLQDPLSTSLAKSSAPLSTSRRSGPSRPAASSTRTSTCPTLRR